METRLNPFDLSVCVCFFLSHKAVFQEAVLKSAVRRNLSLLYSRITAIFTDYLKNSLHILKSSA